MHNDKAKLNQSITTKIKDVKPVTETNKAKNNESLPTNFKNKIENKQVLPNNNSNGSKISNYKLKPEEEIKVRNLTNNYISYSVIIKDKEFLKLIDFDGLKTKVKIFLKLTFSSKKINWKVVDGKVFEFMKNKILDNSISKENKTLKELEEIQISYQQYHKYKFVKENLKNLDSLIPKINKTKFIISTPEHEYCNVNCVEICKINFSSYKDFIKCSKSACLCSKFDILSNYSTYFRNGLHK